MRVLVVGTGSRGGVGRYEQLLTAALGELQRLGELEWRGVWRRPHPEYLSRGSTTGHEADSSLRRLLGDLREVRTWRPDLVYFTHVHLARIGPLLPLLGIKCRYIVGTHGLEVWDRLHWTKRLPLQRSAIVAAVSEYSRTKVIEVQGVSPERCMTVHLALEEHWLAAADTLLKEQRAGRAANFDGVYRLLSVTRLESTAREKGVDWVLRAMASLASANPHLRYTVVGEGDELPRLQRLAARLGVGDRVTFTGALSHDALLAAYRDCHIFVLPSRREGFGLVFLEAMAFGKPIIAAASAGTLDVVTAGRQGLLVDEESELAGVVATIMADPALATHLGEEGRVAVSSQFSFAAFVLRLRQLLRTAELA